MSEEMLAKFTEELMERDDPVPTDLIRKYKELGLPESEIATALMARASLAQDVPDSALENSRNRIGELVNSRSAGSEDTESPGFWRSVRRFLGLRDK